MKDKKLIENIAHIAYFFGEQSYYSGNTTEDILNIVHYAREFENINFDWEKDDYLIEVQNYTYLLIEKLKKQNE